MITTDSLLAQVHEVFSHFPPPEASEITDLTNEDGDRLRSGFAGIPWWEIDEATLVENVDMLPLFSPRGFQYYYPAYLCHSLRNFDSSNPVLEFSIYALSTEHSPKLLEWHRRRFEYFTAGQFLMLRLFLQAVLSDRSMFTHHADAERGLHALKQYEDESKDDQAFP